MAKFILKDQINELESYVDPRILSRIEGGEINKFESYSSCDLICFDWLNILESYIRPNRLLICNVADEIFFVCENEAVIERLSQMVEVDESNGGKVLHMFFSALLKSDIDQMDDLEEHITDIEDAMLKDNKTDCISNIIAVRRQLLGLKRYYEQINQIFDGILENENKLIALEELVAFRLLDKKIDRLLSHVLNLRDYVTQVREAYQAQIDIEQNNLMKVFTVVTTIFLPLTLIVGWYGMNFKNMPEVGWPLGYLYVIALSVVVVVGLLLFFKRKNWF